MADRVEKVAYKVVVDTSGVPKELTAGPARQLPGSSAPVERGAEPDSEAFRERVHVRRADDMDRMVHLFARLMKMPQFPRAMGDSFAVFMNQMGMGSALTRVAGMLPGAGGGAGAAGLLGAAGPVGAAIGGLLLLQHQVRHAAGMVTAGRNQMIGGTLGADASGILKGYGTFSAGAAHLGPLGFIADKLNESFQHLIDTADRMSDSFGRYNGQIAAAQAQYRVAQIQANIRMGQAFGPMLEAWNNLKSQIVNVGSSAISALWTGFDKLTGFSTALNGAAALVNMGGKALGLGSIMSQNQMSASEMAGRLGLTAGLLGRYNSLVPNIRGAIGGELPNIPGSIHSRGLADAGLKSLPGDYKRISELRSQISRQEEQIKFTKSQFPSDDTRRALVTEQTKLKDLQNQLASAQKQLEQHKESVKHRARNIGVPAIPHFRPPLPPPSTHGSPAESNQAESGKPTGPPPQKQQSFAPLRSIDIQQSIQFKMDMKLAHEKSVHDAICQVRDQLLRGLGNARDESRLALSMLNLSGGAGMI